MSIIQGTAKSGTTAGGFYDYPIEQSLRFDGSSYLSNTPSAANQSNDFTLSLWAKISKFDADMGLMEAAGGGTDLYAGMALTVRSSAMRLGHWADTGAPSGLQSSANVIRDTSAFYHFLYKKTTSTIVMYINGDEVTNFTDNFPLVAGFNTYFNNSAKVHYIGCRWNTATFFNGYLADIYFIDGQALDASSFGELKSGVWIPKAYTGTYGTNGFHLDFADPNNIGNDVSGNNNHWTVN